jgi:glutamyl-tRNA synthetase
MTEKQYRGRIAPSPTGLLHIGHAVTFWRAYERACAAAGKLVLRIEDLDRDRCRREFADAIIEDLHWFGLDWDEGPEIGGPFAPLYSKPEAFPLFGGMGKIAPRRLDLPMQMLAEGCGGRFARPAR